MRRVRHFYLMGSDMDVVARLGASSAAPATCSIAYSGLLDIILTTDSGGGGESAMEAAQVCNHYERNPVQVTVSALALLWSTRNGPRFDLQPLLPEEGGVHDGATVCAHEDDAGDRARPNKGGQQKTQSDPLQFFLSGVKNIITSDMLEDYFSQIGQVLHLHMTTDPQTKKPGGSGYLTLRTKMDAGNILGMQHNVNGVRINVRKRSALTSEQNGSMSNCGRACPKEKCVPKFVIRNIAEAVAVKDLNEPSVYTGYSLPKLFVKLQYCVSCAIHGKILRSRAKKHRRVRIPPKKKEFVRNMQDNLGAKD
ncbi:40S ribosomal protein S26 [Sparganum proliferum]